MLKAKIKEHGQPGITVNLIDEDYVIAYNVRRDYAELLTGPRIPKITHKQFDEEHKCGGCNYSHSVFYSVEGEIALKMDNDDRPTGLCAGCMVEMLMELQEGRTTVLETQDI